MKAPDKIYFPNDINLLTKLSLAIKQKGDVCYIRKDALLEWARDLKHLYEIPVNNYQASELCIEKAKVFQMIIDKIESL